MGGKKRGWMDEKDESQRLTYEKERDAMLEQNKQRMLELGLADLSKQFARAPRVKRKPNHSQPPPGPIRRSSRYRQKPVQYKPAEFVRKPTQNQNRRSSSPLRRYSSDGEQNWRLIVIPSGPIRRSSRLETTPSKSYKEERAEDEDDADSNSDDEEDSDE